MSDFFHGRKRIIYQCKTRKDKENECCVKPTYNIEALNSFMHAIVGEIRRPQEMSFSLVEGLPCANAQVLFKVSTL